MNTNEMTDELREALLKSYDYNWYLVDYDDDTTLVLPATELSSILDCGFPMDDYGIVSMEQCGE